MKYRKKPIIIEAEQWFPGVKIEGVEELFYAIPAGKPAGEARIETLEGKMKVSPGDWIITGVNGEKYPCKPDVFKKTYELFEENERRKRWIN